MTLNFVLFSTVIHKVVTALLRRLNVGWKESTAYKSIYTWFMMLLSIQLLKWHTRRYKTKNLAPRKFIRTTKQRGARRLLEPIWGIRALVLRENKLSQSPISSNSYTQKNSLITGNKNTLHEFQWRSISTNKIFFLSFLSNEVTKSCTFDGSAKTYFHISCTQFFINRF